MVAVDSLAALPYGDGKGQGDSSSEETAREMPGTPFTGDWYVVVEKGSAALSYAWKALRELTSYRENQLRLRQSVGAPTRIDNYEDPNHVLNLDGKEFMRWHGNSWRRGSMNCYCAVSDWLVQHVRVIMAATEDDRERHVKALVRRSKDFDFHSYCLSCPRRRSSSR